MGRKHKTHTTVGGLNLHLDITAVQKILSDRMLGIKGSADHSRWTCVDRPSCFIDKKLHNNAPHRKCLRKRRLPASACLFFFNQAWHFPVRCQRRCKYNKPNTNHRLHQHPRKKVDEKSCVTPAGTSNELQNEWEENTTHTQ